MCLNLLDDNLNSFILSIPEPINSNNENISNKKIDLLIMPKSKKKIKAEIINGSPYIKIDIKSDYPNVLITRRIVNDGSKYFGPYANPGAAKEMVKILIMKILLFYLLFLIVVINIWNLLFLAIYIKLLKNLRVI